MPVSMRTWASAWTPRASATPLRAVAGLIGADGADGPLLQQGLQLAPVSGGAEHEDGLLLEAGGPEAANVFGSSHGEAGDPLFPEDLSQLDKAGSVAIPRQHGENGRITGPLLDHSDIVFQRSPLKNQLFHVKTTTFCTEIK